MTRAALVVFIVLLAGCTAEPPAPSSETAQEPTVAAPEATATPAPTEEKSAPTLEPSDTPEPSVAPEPTPTEEASPTPEPSLDAPAAQGEVILEQACTACHSLGRVEAARKSREDWVETVDRMIEYGAVLTDADREALIVHLATAFGQ
jgi:hypothetical protein